MILQHDLLHRLYLRKKWLNGTNDSRLLKACLQHGSRYRGHGPIYRAYFAARILSLLMWLNKVAALELR